MSTTSTDPFPPLLKVAALLTTAYAAHRSLSPPNPPPSPKTCIDNRSLFERTVRHVTFCSKMMTLAIVLADSLVTLHLAFPSDFTRPFASVLLPSGSLSSPCISSDPPSPQHTLTQAITVPSAFVLLGALAATLGTLLRIECFRALGHLFTFELTIHPTHKLVTNGPYAHVRHPSYTGVYATLFGASVAMLAPGAWLCEAWLAPSLRAAARWGWSPLLVVMPASDASARLQGQVHLQNTGGAGALLAWMFAVFWTVKVVFALRSTNRRLDTEDRELHRVFGAQWEEWAARVRWRLFPGVY